VQQYSPVFNIYNYISSLGAKPVSRHHLALKLFGFAFLLAEAATIALTDLTAKTTCHLVRVVMPGPAHKLQVKMRANRRVGRDISAMEAESPWAKT
jgi:hypothetical protein